MHAAPLRDLLHEQNSVPGGADGETWPTLLVVDSDREMLRTLACFFEKRGFHVAAADNLADAKVYFQRHPQWTMVISDCHLPDGTGWELQGWMREQPRAATPPFLLMSGGSHAATVCPELDFLAKPFRIEELETRVRALLRLRQN